MMQNKLMRFLCLVVMCMFVPTGQAAESILPKSLQKILNKHRISSKNAAIIVYRIDDKKMLASHLASRVTNPASLAKLPLTFAAFDLLGPDYQWQTVIATDGTIEKGVLNGDLYLIGNGDPLLSDARFLSLLSRLRLRGLRDIRGRLIIDDSYFILPPHHAGAFDDKPHRPYNAGGGAVVVNFNAQEIVFIANESKVQVMVEPPNQHINVNYTLTAARGRCRNWRRRVREQYRGDRQYINLSLVGRYPKRCKTQSFYTSLLSSSANAAGTFGAMWQMMGGTWNGEWQVGQVPSSAVTLMVYESPPLQQAATDMNKYSNNVIARNLFMSLPATSAEPPYTQYQARDVLHQWMREQGVRGDFYIDNGSGLSREVRMSASQIFNILQKMWAHPLRADMISSLSLLGVDGTLQKRLAKSAPQMGHLKTGSLKNVKNIAGYLRDKQGRDLILIALINNTSAYRAKNFQDELMRWAMQRK